MASAAKPSPGWQADHFAPLVMTRTLSFLGEQQPVQGAAK